jgi:hypothetical protein
MMSSDAPAVTPGVNQGSVGLSGLSVRTGGAWTELPAALATTAGWSAGAENPAGCSTTGGQVQAGPSGLRWSFRSGSACSPALRRADTPATLPALVSRQLTSRLQAFPTVGLDGRQLLVKPVALAAAVPGAPAVGVVVDRTFAQRKAFYADDSLVAEQVWVTPGSLASMRARLAAAGVKIDGVATAADAEAVLMRQGPALASVLFLAAAAAAALLAGGAAVLGLYQAGRRRSYEYAALIAGRVPRRSLRASVFIEQSVVLGFGVLTGGGGRHRVGRAGAAQPAGVPRPAGGAVAAVRPVGHAGRGPARVHRGAAGGSRRGGHRASDPVGPARTAQGGAAMTAPAVPGRPLREPGSRVRHPGQRGGRAQGSGSGHRAG